VTKLQVVSNYAKDRPVIFSSFQPDAAKLVRELQSTYPVCSILALFFDKYQKKILDFFMEKSLKI